MTARFAKDPAATLDYGWDWSEWLADGEVIASASWSVPAGLVLESTDHNATLAVAWISGGDVGAQYRITNRIETSAGRVDERSVLIYVVER